MSPHPLTEFFPEAESRRPSRCQPVRKERLVVMITPDEKAQFAHRAFERGITLSALIRGLAASLPPPRVELEVSAALHNLQNTLWFMYDALTPEAPLEDRLEDQLDLIQELYETLVSRLGGPQ